MTGVVLSRRGFVAGATGLALIGEPALAQPEVAAMVGGGGATVTVDGISGIVLAGRTRAAGGRTLFANDKWHIGSNTKAMTAALYARLVEAGRASWGASIPDLFPDLDVDAAWSAVSVERLMGHAAGVGDASIDRAWLLARHGDRTDVRAQRTAFSRTLLAKPPAGTPGTYAYGNAGYMLLGAAIERAAGASWEATMARDLFAPLGMTSAGFGAPATIGPWGHAETPAGFVGADPAGVADNPAVMGPAGRVHLTLGDYARFLSIFLGGGDGFLKPETISRLLTPVAGGSYAGGWGIEEDADGRVLAHEGSNTLWHAAARLHPALGIGHVGVVNMGGATGRAAALAMMERVGGMRPRAGRGSDAGER